MTQFATDVYWRNKVGASATNKKRGEENDLRRRVSLRNPPEHVSTLTPTSLCRDTEVTLENDLLAAGLVSSAVTARYRANGHTHPHENQQGDTWCMYIFNFVCSRVFDSRVSLCFKNQSLLNRIRLKN